MKQSSRLQRRKKAVAAHDKTQQRHERKRGRRKSNKFQLKFEFFMWKNRTNTHTRHKETKKS